MDDPAGVGRDDHCGCCSDQRSVHAEVLPLGAHVTVECHGGDCGATHGRMGGWGTGWVAMGTLSG